MQQAANAGDSSNQLALATGGQFLGEALHDEFGPLSQAPGQHDGGESAQQAAFSAGWEAAVNGAGKGKQHAPAIQLTVDSRAQGSEAAAAGTSGAPAGHGAGVSSSIAVREESGGLEYAPDSKAPMAHINRWWKKLDERYMQPHFGGPSRGSSSANLAGLAGAAAALASAVQQSGASFSVPARMVGTRVDL
jgi:hypothetical protein